MPEELKKLGGEVDTQFTYRPDQTSFASALAAVKADQEAVVGYKLILLKERSMELVEQQTAIPYVECFVTFGPYPTVTEELAVLDPSLRPPPPPPPLPDHHHPNMDGSQTAAGIDGTKP